VFYPCFANLAFITVYLLLWYLKKWIIYEEVFLADEMNYLKMDSVIFHTIIHQTFSILDG